MIKQVDLDAVFNNIKSLNSDLITNFPNDDVIKDYVNRAGLYVAPLDAPSGIQNTLIRLWALHLMTVDSSDYVTSKHLGDMSKTYADLSKQDDDPLAEFKSLCVQYGLGQGATLYGF